MYEYKANVIRVIDGDTVDVDIDLGFGVWLRGERVRMMGIDTPESRTSNKVEKVFGLAAKEYLKSLLGKNTVLRTQVVKGEDAKGKFGRILGDFDVYDAVTDSWRPATQMMLLAHHCVPYFGESKDDVQQQHMNNRRILIESGAVNMTLEKAELI